MVHKKKKNSSKVNLTISTIVHAALVGALVFFAAKEGLLGKKLKELTVTMVPKEKKPEPPKEKPPEVKPQTPTTPQKAPVNVPPPKAEVAAAPPPAAANAPIAAPAAVTVPEFDFEGGKAVETITDPHTVYKQLIEYSLRSKWQRPEDISDEKFVAEVELTIDKAGRIEDSRWVTLSGNARWDASVKAALASTKALN